MFVMILLLLLVEVVLIYRVCYCLVYKAKNAKGIEQDCYVKLNNTKQFLQIRGADVNNPIVLFLHDGPGMTYSYLSYSFLNSFKEDYMLVYWEQTGCGRSSDSREEAITYERVFEDLENVVEYLLNRFHKEKIIIMGHSCGSYLGVNYIKKHPEHVEAFISIGQLIKTQEGISKSIERVMNMYQKRQREDSHDLFKFLSKIQNKQKLDLDTFLDYKEVKAKLDASLCPGREEAYVKNFLLAVRSPDISIKDIRWLFWFHFQIKEYMKKYGAYLQRLADADIIEEFGTEYEVPFYMIYGEKDYFTPPELISEFYNQLSAPRKNLIEILDTGHRPHLDNPKTFNFSVGNLLRELYSKK